MKFKHMAESLVRKFKTRNPFEIANALGYIVVRVPLKGIRGFYQHIHRCTIIYIDVALHEWDAAFVCAHEIGHVLLHRGYNRIFMDANTYFKVDQYEIEADRFAVCLRFSDATILPFITMPTEFYAVAIGVSTELAEYRQRVSVLWPYIENACMPEIAK